MARTDPELRRQYRDASNLEARKRLHARFSTNPNWARWVFDQLALPADAHVLELGCGTCDLWATNRDRIGPDWRVMLTDFSPGMLGRARRELASLGRAVSYAVADAQAIPLLDETVDAVIANHMLYHVPDIALAVAQVRRVLKRDGRLYAATNGADHMIELPQIVAKVAPDLPFARGEGAARTFGLENGSDILAAMFADVELRRFDNGLRVTESQALIDYVLSLPQAPECMTPVRVDALRSLLERRIDAERGLRITLSAGLFIAHGAAR
jgi:SAM-dependent methyltransferase